MHKRASGALHRCYGLERSTSDQKQLAEIKTATTVLVQLIGGMCTGCKSKYEAWFSQTMDSTNLPTQLCFCSQLLGCRDDALIIESMLSGTINSDAVA